LLKAFLQWGDTALEMGLDVPKRIAGDDPYVDFRMRTFVAGTLLSLVGAGAYASYYAMSWSGPNRQWLVAVSVGSLVGTLLLQLAPIERIVASDRLREPFFVAWSSTLIAIISGGAALDGGAHSALALAFFLPLAFAALSYPTGTMVIVTALTVGAFLTVAITCGNASTAFIFMFSCALTTAGWMSAWQARNHERHLADRRRDEERIARLAYNDSLTGLANRAELVQRLTEAVEGREPFALLTVDLDGFKVVNDSLGHSAGDEILQEVAGRLERATAGAALLARHGGDEFAVLATALGDDPRARATEMAERVLGAIRQPLSIDETEFELDAGIGIVLFPNHGARAEDLLRRAGAAMHDAKAAGFGSVCVYESDRHDSHTRLQLTSRLRRALANGELVVHYQPILEPTSGRIAALEALVRWEDPDHGLIPPLDFIPFAEETGLISAIGDRVVDIVCEQARRWRDAGLLPAICFNVSPRELRAPDYAKRLRDRIEAAGLDPAGFTVEITESAMVGDPARVEPVLHDLAAAGLRLAIDDFGAEHSSLGRLRTLPVNMLKVDRSLLNGVPDESRGSAIVASLLTLAQSLQIISVVEGVETEEQSRFLVQHQCPLAQGFALGRPAPVEATTRLLEQDAVAQQLRAHGQFAAEETAERA
jgi:diguanylate cyclase (GGDEF)-like protein